ncbi:hypothetical protein [Halostella salina]|uniref:hypothetical protein n=1 Tax=Halostella salina TaxID=1547897 RepID=UPI000EF817D0|nr:hypothetical protein [Halostella salina]
MSPTVDDLRNEIRESVGRYERIESTGFTKEALAAICEALDCDLATEPTPPKSEMRAATRRAVGADPDNGGAFRKADLKAIAAAIREM